MSNLTPQQEEWKAPEPKGAKDESGPGSKRLAVALAVGLVAVATIAYGWMANAAPEDGTEGVPTITVKRGALTVSVTEGGTLLAREKVEIKSEVEGRNQILEIVPEGTIITEDDVNLDDPTKGMLLVRLDAADLEEKKAARDIRYYNAAAAQTQAEKSYEIQLKQNESNEAQARLEVKFAHMELQKYLGAELAAQVIEQKGVDFDSLRRFASLEVQNILDPTDPSKARNVLGPLFVEAGAGVESLLGGTAAQTLRDLSSQVQLARQRLEQAVDTLQWTEKLVEGKYVNRTELTRDILDRDAKAVQVAAAEEDLRLFVQYTLPKDAEQRYSDCEEAERKLDRVLAQNASQLAQTEANRRSKRATFELEKSRKEKLDEMLANSTVYATKPGLVVYASTSAGHWRGEPIQEGTTIRQNQTILTIPNLSTLAARVNVHETDIEKMKIGQPARIKVEALPGSSFPGHVARISPMASSENRWLNPDVIVYETDVALDEIPEGLSPGMSATAEIIIAELQDVLYVPLSAVTTYRGQRVCWVKPPSGEPELRQVETGYFTDKFVEIRNGLRAGEVVYLAPPKEMEEESLEERAERENVAQPPAPGAPLGRNAASPRPGPTPAAPAGRPEEQPEAKPAAEGAPLDMDALRKEMENLSPEERRAKMREALEQMSPGQREQMMRQRGGGPGGRRDPGGRGQQGGGAPANGDR